MKDKSEHLPSHPSSKSNVQSIPVLNPSQAQEFSASPQEALASALAISKHPNPVKLPKLKTTRHRSITKRGVLWLGQTCNLRCHFCYFLDRIESRDHPEHPFMSLDKSKEICSTLVNTYGNTAIDIQGGEPTIWPGIYDLIRHCNKIGLYPTLITNAIALDKMDKLKKFQDAGIRDFLVSVHGLGETHDKVVQLAGAHKKQMKALYNMQELGIPFRFNCVLSKAVVPQLPQVAKLAVELGARAVNFLAFNPFEDQAKGGKRSTENVPMYSELAPQLNQALDILDEANIEANVRYYPLCMTERRHLKSMYNFQQLSYDHHEWDYASWTWTGMQEQRMKGGDTAPTPVLSTQRLEWDYRNQLQFLYEMPLFGNLFKKLFSGFSRGLESFKNKETMYREDAKLRAELHCAYRYGKACQDCSVKEICDGFHGDYADLFGTEEANAILLDTDIKDPTTFIAEQNKTVEPEDEHWALP